MENLKGWREFKLGDVTEVFDGPHATPKKTMMGPIFLGISSLNRGQLAESKYEYISEEDYVRWTKRITPRHRDIVFSYETRLGEAAIIPPNMRCCLGRRLGLIRSNEKHVDPFFLLYYYLGPLFQSVIHERTIHGTTVDRIPLIDMPKFPILLPPLPEQKAIASVLSSLDDKIDLLHRQNKTLEAMAETLFRQWFVEEADEGWEEGTISQLVTIQNGYAFKSKDFQQSGDNGIVKIKNISGGIIDIENTDFIGSETACKTNDQFRVHSGDILIAMTGAEIGKLGIIPETKKALWLNQRVGLLKEKYCGSKYLAYLHLKSEYGQDYINNTATGSAQPNISSTGIENCGFPVISERMIKGFSLQIGELFTYVIFNLGQIRTLEKLRDTLLPKLMSGEIRVKI